MRDVKCTNCGKDLSSSFNLSNDVMCIKCAYDSLPLGHHGVDSSFYLDYELDVEDERN